jgi:hypothetical protein
VKAATIDIYTLADYSDGLKDRQQSTQTLRERGVVIEVNPLEIRSGRETK